MFSVHGTFDVLYWILLLLKCPSTSKSTHNLTGISRPLPYLLRGKGVARGARVDARLEAHLVRHPVPHARHDAVLHNNDGAKVTAGLIQRALYKLINNRLCTCRIVKDAMPTN